MLIGYGSVSPGWSSYGSLQNILCCDVFAVGTAS